MKIKKASFQQFYDRFPSIDFPVSLGETQHHIFSNSNLPLSQSMLEEYILPYEDEYDEFTEFVPCFRIVEQEKFVGVVYWRAKLLDYHYILSLFDKNGHHISKAHIAGTRTDGEKLAHLVAHIDEDMKINMIIGQNKIDESVFDPTTSKAFLINIDSEGNIDIIMNENLL